jgi:hypothetical protein
MHDHERARTDARTRVDTAAAEAARTDAIWRQARVDTAQARFEVLVAEREVIRAHAVNRALPGDETYDSAPVRGQFSRAQQRWYAVASRGHTARDDFERASRDLASAKEVYAQLMRHGPARMPDLPPAPEDHSTRYELIGWSVQRSDIRRRRGLQHFLDDVFAAPPTLRKMTYQPSRAMRTAVATGTADSAPGGAADPATAVAARPSADHPADRAVADKPGAPAASTAVAAKPAGPSPTAAAKTAASAPSGTAAVKPAAPSTALAVKPVSAPAAKAAAPASGAASPATDHPADRAAAANGAAPTGTTSAAKPVEHTSSDGDSRAH